MKQADYKKLFPIVAHMEVAGQISIKEAMDLTGKSKTIAWRYLKMLVDAGVAEAKGETDNSTCVLKVEYATSASKASVSTK